jgi:hypothetical protein
MRAMRRMSSRGRVDPVIDLVLGEADGGGRLLSAQ